MRTKPVRTVVKALIRFMLLWFIDTLSLWATAAILSVTLFLTRTMPLIMVLFLGPAVGVVLVANVLDLDDELPGWLHLPHWDAGECWAFWA